MNTKKKIVSGLLAAAFAVSLSPSVTFADHWANLDQQTLKISEKFVAKYAGYDLEKRMKMNDRISELVLKLSQSKGNSATKIKDSKWKEISATKSQRDRLVNALTYIDIELNNFDMTVNSGQSAAVDLNVTLQSLLKEHVNLSLNVLRSAYDGNAELGASLKELDDNTADLGATIGSVYGAEAEARFLEIWRAHIGFFADQTTGLKTNDDEIVAKAERDLVQYQDDISDFFSGAIPLVMKETIVAGSGVHAKLLGDSMKAYDKGDYAEAYRLQAEADTQIEWVADLLSKGIVAQFPAKFSTYNVEDQSKALTSKAAVLRLELNDLLREHVNVSLNVLRNAYSGTEDFDESLAALDVNTVELAATVGSVYGADAEAAFLKIWRDHIGFFAQHTTGLATDDAELTALGIANLKDYQQSIGDFFSGAVPFIMKSTVVAGSGEHARLLLESMEAFDKGDYATAYELQTQADEQISGIANLLAMGITMQFPEKFAETK